MFDLRFVMVPLRTVLVLAFLLVLVFQTLSMPGQFAYMAEQNPDEAYLRWPLTIFAVLELACVQVVIVAVWNLLSMVKDDRIFSDSSFKWVSAIQVAIAAAWAMFLAAFLYFGFTADDPGVPMLLSLFMVALTVLMLLMVVMRALLRQATNLQTDIDGVL